MLRPTVLDFSDDLSTKTPWRQFLKLAKLTQVFLGFLCVWWQEGVGAAEAQLSSVRLKPV